MTSVKSGGGKVDNLRYATSLHLMFSTVRSPYSKSVMR